MEKYQRYYGLMLFGLVLFVAIYGSYMLIQPKIDELSQVNSSIEERLNVLQGKENERRIVVNKIRDLKDSIATSAKKVYYPVESDLGNDTLFFTLYNDVLEMIHTNGIKIKALNYEHNPSEDKFVEYGGKDKYFVCDLNMELVSNYKKLGQLVENIYQYPSYIKINELEVTPYEKDKKILVSKLSLRLYAHTSPDDTESIPANNKKPN